MVNLQISRLKLKVHSKDTTKLEFHQTLHRLSLSGPRLVSKIKGFTSHSVHIGGAKMANDVTRKWKYHFGATYMDGMTGDARFLNGLLKFCISLSPCRIPYYAFRRPK